MIVAPSSSELRIIVLGSGAGGGVPQWNCNCRVCQFAWKNSGHVIRRTQSSIAVNCDGENWCIFNCSPDIRQQILETECLHPRNHQSRGSRTSPIHSIVLTNAEIDHISGLLLLREKQRIHLWATPTILNVLEENPIFNVLDQEFVTRKAITLEEPFETAPGLIVEAFPVPGKIALFLEDPTKNELDESDLYPETETTIGLRIYPSDGGVGFFYIPGCAKITKTVAKRIQDASLVLFDGTVWKDDEMISHGVGQKTGRRMGHISIAGKHGSMAAFEKLNVARKVYVHLNNTNPVLIEDSAERKAVEEQGWEIAYDGMEIRM